MQKQARLQRKRLAILEAAAQAFREDGYDASSMDRVAQLAGASKRTVYNHFRSKEALFEAVIVHLFQQIRAAHTPTWDASRALDEQLLDFARVKMALVEDPAWAGLLRVALGVFVSHPELARSTVLRAIPEDDRLVHWLRDATAAEQLRATDAEAAASQFWAMIKGAVVWPAVFGLHASDTTPEAREALARDMIETFLCRYRADAGQR